jgi:hypothetical protein
VLFFGVTHEVTIASENLLSTVAGHLLETPVSKDDGIVGQCGVKDDNTVWAGGHSELEQPQSILQLIYRGTVFQFHRVEVIGVNGEKL